jgi:hypothetical protein
MGRFLFLFCLIATVAKGQRVEPLLFSEKVHDFGEIPEKGGKVEFEFTFLNNTARSIRILSVEASCGCTTTGYSKDEIKQGKSGFVKANFDPLGRPGYFNKTITVATDYNGEPTVLQIKGQVKSGESKDILSEFTAKNGSLLLKHKSFNFQKVFINREPVVTEFTVVNSSDKPLHFLSNTTSPDYISVTLPKVIQPKQQASIKIAYDAKKKNQYGFFSDTIEWQSDDELQPLKSFLVHATIEEYFPPLSEIERPKAAKLVLEQYSISMGRISSDAEQQREITLKNAGKKGLVIRALQPNCTCISASVSKSNIKPEEEGKLFITFNPKGRVGQQNKSITVYSTDPQNPVQRVVISGYIPNKD